MSTRPPYFNSAYGLTDALLNVFPAPIVSTRNPTTKDRAQFGTVWVNKSTNNYFVLTSIVANIATWTSTSNGAGIFFSLEATGGDITADVGNIVATLGNLEAPAGQVIAGGSITSTTGDITATAGSVTAGTFVLADANITSTNGDIIALNGDITASVGDITAGGAITASLGDITATAGNVIVSAGNITVTLGDITAATGDIEASSGAVRGAQVEASGDLGGVVSVTSFTNAVNTSQSTGALSIVSTTANPGDNAGFLKVYVGATTAYVPYFTNIAP